MHPKYMLGLVLALGLSTGLCPTVVAGDRSFVEGIPIAELISHARSVRHLKAFRGGRECGLVARIRHLARHYDPALSSEPILLRFYQEGAMLRGEVHGGQHRLLALLKRLNGVHRPRVKDIPRGGWAWLDRPGSLAALPKSPLVHGVSMGELWQGYCQVELEAREIQRLISPPQPTPAATGSLLGWLRRLLK